MTLIYESHDTGEQPRYRVWEASNVGARHYAVESPQKAADFINRRAEEMLLNPRVVWNTFGLEELEEDGYHEWYDEQGRDIDDLIDEEEE